MAIKITYGDLRIADIIVSTTGANISAAIRSAIGSDISHAALFTKPNYIIEAIGEGVKEHRIEEALKEDTLALALRRTHMTDEQRKKVVEAAEQFAGREYDKIGAAGSGMTSKRGSLLGIAGCMLSPIACGVTASEISSNASDENKDKKFFCSELVARAFQLAGVPIVDGEPTFTNPRAIRTSSRLIYIGHLIGG
ncbi:MAG: hypothetical protein M3033_14380 [Acidobacteriota bacterium]|nr:hypothetical protein [Acidobacteriota bacterium]